jgi:hypothetical protein
MTLLQSSLPWPACGTTLESWQNGYNGDQGGIAMKRQLSLKKKLLLSLLVAVACYGVADLLVTKYAPPAETCAAVASIDQTPCVRVVVTDATIGRAVVRNSLFGAPVVSNDEFLIVRLHVSNLTSNTLMSHDDPTLFVDSPPFGRATVVDQSGKRYVSLPLRADDAASPVIEPNVAVYDAILFEKPSEKTRSLSIIVPAARYGCDGELHLNFEISGRWKNVAYE